VEGEKGEGGGGVLILRTTWSVSINQPNYDRLCIDSCKSKASRGYEGKRCKSIEGNV
jgi:hypothetical protein